MRVIHAAEYTEVPPITSCGSAFDCAAKDRQIKGFNSRVIKSRDITYVTEVCYIVLSCIIMSGKNLLAESVPLFSIALAVIMLRCYDRTRIVKSVGKDDWVMLCAGVRIVNEVWCFPTY